MDEFKTLPRYKTGGSVAKENNKPSGDAAKLVKSKPSGKSASAPFGAKGADKYKRGGKAC